MTDNVHYLEERFRSIEREQLKHGGGNDGGSGLEKRVEKLENTMTDVQARLVRIESKLDFIATKADQAELAGSIHKAMNEQTWKFIGAATGLAGLFAAISFGLARALA
ncbi:MULTISPECIES: hypothetical protein [unclassified Pseudomonas]|uniref:hypothetical protein n=1 Tax=unclassified Pseudomonas TaxID=196821 RepID=UPI000A1DB53D|nr:MULTISPECIES: hypothetical protein [unclassified Pseudomonas]